MRALLDWLEERAGVGAGVRELGRTPVAHPARFGRVTGFVLAGGLLLQLLTGIGLAAHYAPSTTTAWGSIVYLEQSVLAGRLLRGLHAFGASAVVICVLLHLTQKAWRLDFARRLGWLLGLALIPLLAGFSLTGYLLPWDQRGYWATQVAASITGNTGGAMASRVFLGGTELSTLTLTRFFTAHTVVLPLTTVALGLLALRVWRRESELETQQEGVHAAPYWPRHAGRDAGAVALVAAIVTALALAVGPHLEAPADPESDFPPRPEWYFSPLRELLKHAPEPLGSAVIPGAVFLLWAGLPWILGKGGESRQKAVRGAVVLSVGLYGGLLLQTQLADLNNADYQRRLETAARDAALARELAREGIPPEGPAELLRKHPPRLGRAVFETHCNRCHIAEGKGERAGPVLDGYLSVGWLRRVIKDPRHDDFFGKTKIDAMPPFEGSDEDLSAIATYVRSLDPSVTDLPADLIARGKQAYVKHECNACHKVSEGAEDLGPNLFGYGSEAWLLAFLKNPASDLFYSEDNEMPAYAEELSEEELKAVVYFLRGLDGDVKK